ncbi:hypothetical protein D3C84_1006200 [compost metagenome]
MVGGWQSGDGQVTNRYVGGMRRIPLHCSEDFGELNKCNESYERYSYEIGWFENLTNSGNVIRV